VAEVQVGFRAVVQDVDLTVLIGTHSAGVDVDIRIEFLNGHTETALLQQQSDRRRGDPFADRTDHAAGEEYVSRHFALLTGLKRRWGG
jgi:hypothetical protein